MCSNDPNNVLPCLYSYYFVDFGQQKFKGGRNCITAICRKRTEAKYWIKGTCTMCIQIDTWFTSVAPTCTCILYIDSA